jgi:hypothetical protein
MAVSFNGSTDYLSVADSGISDETILITAWAYVNSDNGATNTIASYGSSANQGAFSLTASMGATNNPTRAIKSNSSGGVGPASLNTSPVGSWFSCAALFLSNTSRYVYRGGSRSAQDTTSVADTTYSKFVIGAKAETTPINLLTGRAAEVAVYTSITLAEADAIHAAHAVGYSPLLCPRADAIYEYWPLINVANLQGLIHGLTLSATGSPTSVAHPRIIRPSARIYSFPSSAAAPASFIASWARRRTQVIGSGVS